jgi:hypothetical protein
VYYLIIYLRELYVFYNLHLNFIDIQHHYKGIILCQNLLAMSITCLFHFWPMFCFCFHLLTFLHLPFLHLPFSYLPFPVLHKVVLAISHTCHVTACYYPALLVCRLRLRKAVMHIWYDAQHFCCLFSTHNLFTLARTCLWNLNGGMFLMFSRCL